MIQDNWRRSLWIMFTAQLLSAVGFSTIFPFLSLYVEALGSSYGFSIEFLAAMVFSSQAITMMVSAPIWGTIADMFGRKIMMGRAFFGGSIIVLLMAFVSNAEQLVLLRAIQGLITGTVAAANAMVAAIVPKEHNGYAMGVLQTGTWTGIAIGPILGGFMADWIGFRAAFIITAVLLFAGGCLIVWGVEENFTRPPKRKMSIAKSWWGIVSKPGVFSIYSVRFMAFLSRSIFVPFAPLYIALLASSSENISTLTGIMIGIGSAAGTVSALYLGGLGDRVGHKKILTICTAVAAISIFPQAFVTTVWQLIVLQIFTGAAFGGIMPAISALLNEFTEQADVGAAFGFDNAITSAARACGPLLGGIIVAMFGLRIFVFSMGVLLAIALVMVIFLIQKNETTLKASFKT